MGHTGVSRKSANDVPWETLRQTPALGNTASDSCPLLYFRDRNLFYNLYTKKLISHLCQQESVCVLSDDPVGSRVLSLTAIDLDASSDLRYNIVPDSYTARDPFNRVVTQSANFDFRVRFHLFTKFKKL